MLICIPQVLSAEQVAFCRKVMDEAEWTDGKVTAGAQSGSVKNNLQLPENCSGLLPGSCALPGSAVLVVARTSCYMLTIKSKIMF